MPLGTPVEGIGGPGDSRIRITLRAISSASSSAESVGFDTFVGSRVLLEHWIEGETAALTDAGVSVGPFADMARDRAMKVCAAWFPRRS